MKYWTIDYRGEFGQYIQETWSEDQIIESYYTMWCGNKLQNVFGADISKEKCIKDWVSYQYAIQTTEYGTILESE